MHIGDMKNIEILFLLTKIKKTPLMSPEHEKREI